MSGSDVANATALAIIASVAIYGFRYFYDHFKAKLDKMNLTVLTATNGPCENAERELKVELRDARNAPVGIKCVSLGDSGLCVHADTGKPGRYTLNLSYTFEIRDETRALEAKLLVLDGKVSGQEPISEDGGMSWLLRRINEKLQLESSNQLVDEEAILRILQNRSYESIDESSKKFSLMKQLRRESTISQLIGAQDLTEAARRFQTLEEVAVVMKKAGLESGNLIFGIDYTASNKTQGRHTFGGRSLHHIDHTSMNPYQSVISILGRTLESFSNQGIIPTYGFGDAKTSDTAVFPIAGVRGHCASFQDVLDVYNTMTPKVTLSGPTNFAPIIREAIKIAEKDPAYYLLVIVADGQVNSEPETVQAIVDACAYPISIIVVGVGDGPWETMNEFDERIPSRPWDNFNFVNFHMVTTGENHPEASFAVHALSEVPDQYEIIRKLGLLK